MAQAYGALPHEAEELDSAQVHEVEERQPRVSRAALIGMAGFAGFFAVIGATVRVTSPSSTLDALLETRGGMPKTGPGAAGPPSSADSESTLNFKAQNVYTRVNGASGLGYSHINPYKLVEPFRESTFEVTDAEDSCSYEWAVWSPSGELYNMTGTNVTFTAEVVGEYPLHLTAVCGSARKHYNGAVVSKYVRRELRSLTTDDKVKFFNTMEIVYKTNREDGQAAYGDYFEPIDKLVAYHNQLAGSKYCDHMHDGYGFLTQHAALSKWFEVVLQAIEPSVALPYWDYTIEGQAVNNTGDIAKWRHSDVFDPEQFGPCVKTGAVTEGRFAYTVTRKNSHDYIVPTVNGTNRTEGNYAAVNAYGFMRAPWNQNNIPYLTRINNTYGFELTEVPNCHDHKDALEQDTFSDFGAFIAYTPHGTTHIAIGGVGGSDFKNILKAHDYDLEMAEHWVPIAFAYQKNMYRAGWLECPVTCSSDTPVSECKCTCPDLADMLALSPDQLWGEYMNVVLALNYKYIFNKNGTNIQDVILKMLCNHYDGMASVMGDSLESASPNDPSFWPTHPTVERLMVWKRINGFSDESWPDDEAWSVKGFDIEYCYGHNSDDVLPWPTHTYAPVMGPYTNAQIWELTDPTYSDATYIYDNFRWDHCEEAGFPKTLIPSDIVVDDRDSM